MATYSSLVLSEEVLLSKRNGKSLGKIHLEGQTYYTSVAM